MKKLRNVMMGFAVLTMTLVPVAVYAVDDTMQQQATTTSTQGSQATEMQSRIEKRKTDAKVKLSNAQKTRLQDRCKASQKNLTSIKTRLQATETKRTEFYNRLVASLQGLSQRLQAQGVATTDLDAAVTTLNGSLTTYTNDLATYKQALGDLSDMDCSADPEGFKASLDTAKTALANVTKDAGDIHAYVRETIKPILVTIRGQLGAN